MPEVVISEFMDEAAVDALRARHETLYDPDLVDRIEDLKAALKGAKALVVRNRTKVTAEILKASSDLQCVGRLGVGLDNIDLKACEAAGVTVYPATGANDVAVAEYVVSSALSLLRGAYHRSADVAAGRWPRQQMIGREAMDKRLGLVGFGGIARQVAARGRVIGFEIAAHDPFLPEADAAWQNATRLDLGALLETSDVISLHVPLTEGTRHLIDGRAIAGMKPGAILINTARGGVVDEPALTEALRAGKLGGAALDVFETEPLTAEAGRIFDGIANLILTPHIAGVTEEANVRVSALTAENVLNHLAKGRP
ncbi:D-isomer specific 2-hydroxyacid dehydrogenase, catalytic region:D-isomer specific 2-hydroxyacid dehydrogenase [Fulvimarina pelagi HTCC2506]|uniref:D-isomer specific 2-hydroxyacid dehydrogenase, catalytic region:D-isomer specific 2-hydroxyacid dehydrogenase n=1 Tax=Fulvimarina pelagi HTCC2506 TaxID=314231 RepID=Q0G466_9HYPH|nr:hydroxyacid dehydrogenase [Fulvimarina pelagi]EAU41615.1 D-isomer specific 2-hydroxyacid dehydrogenase, catalytic region:D-isomer specific 2-hydroxyacid dehydrogenase [Fulvimarina pelagi HTCC2506]